MKITHILGFLALVAAGAGLEYRGEIVFVAECKLRGKQVFWPTGGNPSCVDIEEYLDPFGSYQRREAKENIAEYERKLRELELER